jgi:hypothetical protein
MEARASAPVTGETHPLRTLVLARVACEGGATRAEMSRDLAPFIAQKLSPAEWRGALDGMLAALVADGLVSEKRARATLTPAGAEAATGLLGPKALMMAWPEMRDIRLVAAALGVPASNAAKLKALARPDALRTAILQKAFGLAVKGTPSPSRLRSALAVVALERAFGNRIKGGLGTGSGLPAKTGRLLAGQLARRPRDFGTDARLIAALAAEQAGSVQQDIDALRLAIVRGFVGPALVREPSLPQPPAPAPRPAAQPSAPPRPAAASRPDLAGFAREVQSAARTRAEGWPGNRKAYISHVWQALVARHPDWGLTPIEFKGMLAEAHRTGHVTLANADLKDKKTMKEVQESAIAYKNTVWHFVRVED